MPIESWTQPSAAQVLAWLQGAAGDPLLLAFLVIGFSLISEDATTVGAALLASGGFAHPLYLFLLANLAILIGDAGLYLMGRTGGRIRPLRRLLAHRRLYRFRRWLKRHEGAVLVASRFLPGSRLPTYAACGFYRLSFPRFLGWLSLGSLAWTGLVFAVVGATSAAVVALLGGMRWWAGLGLLAAGLVLPHLLRPLVLRLVRVPVLAAAGKGGRKRRRAEIMPVDAVSREEAQTGGAVPAPSGTPLAPPAGMPPLESVGPAVSHFEFWPSWRFYGPMLPIWAALAIRHRGLRWPLAANPGFEMGGLVGERKSDVLARFGPHARAALAPFVVLPAGAPAQRLAVARSALADGRVRLPLIAKPDIGCRGAGVKRIADRDGLAATLALYPEEVPIVLQNCVAAEGEAGIFYVRHPDEAAGRLFSMTLKYFPRVVGDGRRTLRRLIADDPRAGRLAHLYHPRLADRLDEVVPAGEIVRLTRVGAHSKGAIFRDGRPWITPALTRAIDRIARDIDGFFIGRFDVRFDDFAALREGRDFTVIEVNGAGGEATHIWDSRFSLIEAWRDLARQYDLLFRIGRANARRGARLPGYREFWRAWRREARLVARYPFPD